MQQAFLVTSVISLLLISQLSTLCRDTHTALLTSLCHPLLLDGQTQSGALRAAILPYFPLNFSARHFNNNPTVTWKERVELNLFILEWSNLCCWFFCVCFWMEWRKQLHPFSAASLHLLLLLFPSAQSSSAGSSTAEHSVWRMALSTLRCLCCPYRTAES